ncbi:lipoprotein ynfC [Klebsiella variicola]|uniref:Lipoprotein ynfC n=1 Tax=Klebsiella variicola TaxID=244366 RepID=A0A7H4MJL5_KLEVA|nr:lipoprotein ynfC [Klebsiella variicola]
MIWCTQKGIACEKIVLADPGSAAADGVRPPKRPGSLHPEMASFSNEFEFDPLRGPVKDFSQTLLDEHDVVVKEGERSAVKRGMFSIC